MTELSVPTGRMRLRHGLPRGVLLALLALAMLVPLVAALTRPAAPVRAALPGFYVQGRHLYDKTGEKVILYGVNKMIYWMDIDGIPSYAEIAKTGANAVRIQWLT